MSRPPRILWAPRFIEMFGWMLKFLFVFGPKPRDSCTNWSNVTTGNRLPTAAAGSCDTRLAGQPNEVGSKPNAESAWLPSR